MPRTVDSTLNDPSFAGLAPEVQKAVLGKLGVSEGMQGKLLARLSGTSGGPKRPSVKPPALPKELQPPDFMERAGERFKQNIYAIPHALDVASGSKRSDLKSDKAKAEYDKGLQAEAAGVRHMVTGDAKTTLGKAANAVFIAPRTAYSMGKDYLTNPEHLVGDVAAGAVLSKVGAPEVADTPEGRAAQATTRATAEATQSESAIRTPGRQVRETSPAIPEHLRHLTPEARAKYTAKLDAANQSHEAALAESAHKESAERAMNVATRDVQNNLLETERNVKSHLDTRWNGLRETMKGAEVSSPEQVYNGIKSAESEYLRGAPQSVQQFRNLVRELGIKDFAEREDGTLEALANEDGAGKPLDWETARVHTTGIGNRMAAGGLEPNVYQALKYVKEQVLEPALAKAAESRGMAEQYRNLKVDWSNYMNDWRDLKGMAKGGSPVAHSLKSPDAGTVRGHITGKAGERMVQTLERYRKFGAKPELVTGVREMHRVSKLPRIKPVPVPGPSETAATVPKPPGWMESAARVTGKMAGAVAGTAVGHPFIGYAAGGEAGSSILRSIWEKKHAPPPTI